ncbi:MAG: peptide chain release factor 2 [Candidatus Sungbacteria bacterium]|nr:peptide chain release factor 2 [Candidatus Sungbacteria bacterium]
MSAISRTVFDIPALQARSLAIEREMASPDFWQDRAAAHKKSTELAGLKKTITGWERLSGNLKALGELAAAADGSAAEEEIERQYRALAEEIRTAETAARFSAKYDQGNAVLSIFSGAGGKDAEDWAAMLRRMYERWAERKGFKTRTLHEHFGELEGPSGWGLKNVAFEIRGSHAYGLLKRENGVHRLVRISPFDASARRHTSFALVEVMPELVAPDEVSIKPDELQIDFFRSSGPGGQNVNKRETAVRITHLPTKLHVAVQVERSQERNRELAMRLLAAKLYQEHLKEQEREALRLKGETVAIEWGSQIRSYVLHPYQLVKDHRTGYESAKIGEVLDGDIDAFIEAEHR